MYCTHTSTLHKHPIKQTNKQTNKSPTCISIDSCNRHFFQARFRPFSIPKIMENSKAETNETKSTINSNEENPNNNNTINSSAATTVLAEGDGGESNAAVAAGNENEDSRQTRTPFTNLSQVDADLALARTLQEQERAFMMIQMNGDGSDYGSWEVGSYVPEDDDDDDDFDDLNEDENDDSDADDDQVHDQDDYDEEEDAFDVHAHSDDDNPGVELDPVDFPNDEAYARALQDAEDREMATRLLALSGINERDTEEAEDHGRNSQDTWEDVDPDELSYEELLALGDVVGTENRGLSADSIASLPSMSYKMQSNQDGNSESCVICRLDYEDGDTLTVLSCKHSYHSECINNWLQINKVCPVCSAEVSTSGNS